MGQRSSAGGFNCTQPCAVAATLNGRRAPHTLGPPSAERGVMNDVSMHQAGREARALLVVTPRLLDGNKLRLPAACPKGNRSHRARSTQTNAGLVHGMDTMQEWR